MVTYVRTYCVCDYSIAETSNTYIACVKKYGADLYTLLLIYQESEIILYCRSQSNKQEVFFSKLISLTHFEA